MNENKKYLLLFKSLGILFLISGIFSLGIKELSGKGWDFYWGVFVIATLFQYGIYVIGNIFRKDFQETKEWRTFIESEQKKPYKKYQIDLNCSYCGKENRVEVDLVDTTFECKTCHRQNALYVTFMPASMNN